MRLSCFEPLMHRKAAVKGKTKRYFSKVKLRVGIKKGNKLYMYKNILVKRIFLFVIICILVLTSLKLYNIQNLENNTKYCHFSIDDTIDIFRDITANKDKYNSIFENDILHFLKECHEEYGMKTVLFCFYEFNGFSLAETTDKFSHEFKENSDWIKFGFHAYNANSYMDYSVVNLRDSYILFQKEIIRITGKKPETEAVRLDRFAGTEEQLKMLNSDFGIKAFLGADSYDRDNYYLDKEKNAKLRENDTIKINNYFITQTDWRIENMPDDVCVGGDIQDKQLVIFTHEWKINDFVIREMIEKVFYEVTEKGYMFSFKIK